ncbi:MAG: branched-chain amino acid ABC transporter permease [Clostridiales bacterium]|nr:branched-chain amino acid ABC transporter permease [Clostridiales bacterium]
MKLRALKAAFPHTIPVFMGYIFMGLVFGILLRVKGYHFGWALLMSIVIYAGSMQYVAVTLLTPGISLIHVAIMTLMVNARHMFYGLSMIGKFKTMGKKKPYMIFSLTDETYSLLCGAVPLPGVDENWFYFFVSLLNQLYWIVGCTLGGILGSFFTFETKGMDFAMTALFVVIFIEQWKSSKNHTSALLGIIISIICLLAFGADYLIIPAMIGIFLALTLLRSKLDDGREE